MPQIKYLIVNADDFGQSTGINLGVMEAFEKRIVTSASLMVRWRRRDYRVTGFELDAEALGSYCKRR
jgi:predicted glycoside hydrolase/deacetylase ChbG (UPF0249 family)